MLHATYGSAERDAAPSEEGAAGAFSIPSISELASSGKRIIERQGEIWVTQVKAAVLRFGIALGLMAAAAGLAAVGLIFLLIGLYRILTDVLHIAPVWASLIFAAGCGVLAFAALLPVVFARRKKKEQRGGQDAGASD